MIPLYLYRRIKQEQEAARMTEPAEADEEELEQKPVSRFSRFRAIAGAIGRTAASAGSLLADAELRGRAGALVGKQAGQSLTSLKEGVQQETEYITQRINNGLGYVQQGPKHVQSVLARLQKRIEETRLQALLEAERDAPVDVQIGPQLVEEAPQELRSRLWLALMNNPQLCHTYDDGKVEPALSSSSVATQARTAASDSSTRSNDGSVSVGSARSSSSNNQISCVPSKSHATSESAGQLPTCPSGQSPTSHEAPGHPQPKSSTQLNKNEVAKTGGSSDIPRPDMCDPFQQSLDTLHADQQEKEQQAAPGYSSEANAVARLSSSTQDSQEQANVGGSQPQDSQPSQAPAQTPFQNPTDGSQHGKHAASSPATGGAAATEGGSEAVNASPVGSASTDAWEMVQDANNVYNWKAGSLFGRSISSNVRQGSECSEEGESYSQCLMNAVMAVEWPITFEFSEDSRYNTLLQISVGQEEVDEVIGRDINRTFPEHPQFGFEQGQQALYRVLKAHSLHDLEVGYCQGMAFVAGVILMYLPEEPAFRVLCQLLDGAGVGLRSMYLPGLSGLKEELRMLDWLMERLMPELKQHLENYGTVPVLYASQWFLTIYSCPFPATFACRVIDVMLTEHSSNILMRAALAVLAECEDDLLQLHDFEDLITYLKVEPVQWSADHTRVVLSSAITSPTPLCTPPMIEAARLAVQEGYEGTMHRRNSSVSEVAAAVTEAAMVGVISGTSGQTDSAQSGPNRLTSNTAAEASSGPAEEEVSASGPSTNESQGRNDNSSRQEIEMDADQMAMRLALDVLWTGAASGAAQQSSQTSDESSVQQ
ncbi:MAG: GTPase activator NB4S EVI5 [Trebouxia sp. A1-2]|nr:MAG: GTPase activator NB4S EVI5 [Trebouxia sp. A1-2]